MTKLHRVEMIIVDGEGYGINDIMDSLPNRHFQFRLLSSDSVEMEWSDDNPINQRSASKDEMLAEFEKYRDCNICLNTGVIIKGCCSGNSCGCFGLPTNVYRSACGCSLKDHEFIESVYGDVVKHLEWEESAIFV